MQNTEQEFRNEKRSVLVCLSASPSNRKVLRSASRFAAGNHCFLTALYVDTGRSAKETGSLQANMALAVSLGAVVETISHSNVLEAVTEYAITTGVTDLFIGFSGPSAGLFRRHLPAYRLVRALPDVDVHIIPDASVALKPSVLDTGTVRRHRVQDFSIMAGIMGGATLLSVMIDRSRYSNSNIVTVYILAVLITAALTAERFYAVLAAVLYILLFNFLFINPRFSLLVYDPDYMVTYLVSLIAAVITGNISSKMKESTLQASMNAEQARILLNASEALQRAQGRDEIIRITVIRLKELLGREIMFYPPEAIDEAVPSIKTDAASGTGSGDPIVGKMFSAEEENAVRWTLDHKQRTGWGTRQFPELGRQFLAVRTGGGIYGIVAVEASAKKLEPFEENILLSLISACAMSLESEKNRTEREAAQIVARNEQFRSQLLRSISHDLRTPLTSISGNAANLLDHEELFQPEERKTIYTDIYQDSVWLIDLVENLLAITRLEQSVGIHPDGEIVSDVLEAAVSHAQRHKSGHTILLDPDDSCLVAMMDVTLILQVLTNLISNAVKHTPDDTIILVSDREENGKVIISVSDNGPGISPEDKPHIFDLFYVGKKAEADSSRSLGLGLNLCRSILEAHGETISVHDNVPHGTVFSFTLPLWKGNET